MTSSIFVPCATVSLDRNLYDKAALIVLFCLRVTQDVARSVVDNLDAEAATARVSPTESDRPSLKLLTIRLYSTRSQV